MPGAGHLENDPKDLHPNPWRPQIQHRYEKAALCSVKYGSEGHSGLGCLCGPKHSHKCLCQRASETGHAHEESYV